MSGSRYVVTDPNVLTLLDQNATITVDSGSSQDEACVALGSSKDVAGWVASEKSYTRITGLASWSELSTQKGSSTSQGAPTSADDAVSFKDSDMWTAVKCGTGSVSLKSKKTGASTVAIVDLGENVTNAKVQLHWVRSEVPDFAMPFYLPADCWPCWPYCAPPCSPCRRISAASAWWKHGKRRNRGRGTRQHRSVREAGWCKST